MPDPIVDPAPRAAVRGKPPVKPSGPALVAQRLAEKERAGLYGPPPEWHEPTSQERRAESWI